MTPAIVMLDAGNTLFTERVGRNALYVAALVDHGLEVEATDLLVEREAIHDSMPETVDGHPRYSEAWFKVYMARLVERLGGGADPESIRRQLADAFSRPESYVLFPETVDTLEDIQERGLRLALVSNWSRHLRLLLDGLGLSRFFEVTVISEEVGRSKPDPAIFRMALERLDAPAETALHVGDHPINDLAAARRAGIQALLLDREGQHRGNPASIDSLKGLLGFLDSAEGVPGDR